MKLLLDTHAFLWWNGGDLQLPAQFREAIALPSNEVFVSAASVWEIAIKRGSGKIMFDQPIVKAILGHGFRTLAISAEHTEWAGDLPVLHRDPFDRLLVAQAHLEGLTLITVDSHILTYQVPHL